MVKFLTFTLLIVAVLCAQLSSKASEFHGQMHSMVTVKVSDSAGPCNMMDTAAMPAQTAEGDCCGADCMCPSSACAGFNFLGVYSLEVNDSAQNERIASQAPAAPATSVSNLFRPPIIS